MKYRKISSELIFTGVEFLDDKTALVFSEEGEILDLIPLRDAGIDVEQYQGLLMPGFINCHCHLELSHMKGLIPRGTGLPKFVSTVMSQRTADPQAIASAIESAESEMKGSGIIAVGDICNTDLTLKHKLTSDLFYYNFIEATGFLSQNADQRFQIAKKVFEAFDSLGNANHFQSIVPHAPYSVSRRLFELIKAFSEARVLSMHNQESAAENELYETCSGDFLKLYEQLGLDISEFIPTGNTSLASVYDHLLSAGRIILVHNVHTSAADIALCDPDKTSWCLCPKANLYIEGNLSHQMLLLDERNSIVIGTDSLASNNRLSVLEEIQILKANYPSVSVKRLLNAATFAGAIALGIDSTVGTFEKGKKPGVNLLAGVTRDELRMDAKVTRII